MGMLAADRLRYFGNWCPHQEAVFCQNREGCGDCIIKEEYKMMIAMSIPGRIAV
jgi:hypothetical protein